MKAIAFFAALALATGCTTNGAVAPSDAASSNAAVEMRVVAQTGYATTERADAVIATDDPTYRRTWSQLLGGGEPPAIDFATDTAVFLFGGGRPTGGYSVAVRGVSLEGNTLVVDGGVQSPPNGSMTTQAITYPTAVIAVKSRNIQNVRWTP
jgi:hypothetical protein